jgi:hypothetical protein
VRAGRRWDECPRRSRRPSTCTATARVTIGVRPRRVGTAAAASDKGSKRQGLNKSCSPKASPVARYSLIALIALIAPAHACYTQRTDVTHARRAKHTHRTDDTADTRGPPTTIRTHPIPTSSTGTEPALGIMSDSEDVPPPEQQQSASAKPIKASRLPVPRKVSTPALGSLRSQASKERLPGANGTSRTVNKRSSYSHLADQGGM